MILESYNKFEFNMLECGSYTPTQLVKKLNELGNEGWEVVQQFGSFFKSMDSAYLLLQRKIECTKVDEKN